MRSIVIACLCALLPLELACRTTTETFPAGLRNVSATQARRAGLWEVRSDAGVAGFVARYVEEDGATARAYFVVRNADQQDLGIVDALGRAWRYRPHEKDPEWLTTGTILHGARLILGLEGRGELVELETDRPPVQ